VGLHARISAPLTPFFLSLIKAGSAHKGLFQAVPRPRSVASMTFSILTLIGRSSLKPLARFESARSVGLLSVQEDPGNAKGAASYLEAAPLYRLS
jgi:hypothetical protein